MPMIDLTYLRGSVVPPALEHLTDELVTALCVVGDQTLGP